MKNPFSLFVGLAAKTNFNPRIFGNKGSQQVSPRIESPYSIFNSSIISALRFMPLDWDSYTGNVNVFGAKISKEQLLELIGVIENENDFCECIRNLEETTEYVLVIYDTYGFIGSELNVSESSVES